MSWSMEALRTKHGRRTGQRQTGAAGDANDVACDTTGPAAPEPRGGAFASRPYAEQQRLLRNRHRSNGGDAPGCHRLECAVCGRRFYSRYGPDWSKRLAPAPARYCGLACQRAAERQVKQRRQALALHKTCQQCGRPFTARRRTARFCGDACRQAAHRAAAEARTQ
jgi:hypothetical protein